MSARILDGKAIALAVRSEVRAAVDGLRTRGVLPALAVVLVGEDPASQVYVRNKDKAAQEAGFDVRTIRLPATMAEPGAVSSSRALETPAQIE